MRQIGSFTTAASEQRLRAAEPAACNTRRCRVLPHSRNISIASMSRLTGKEGYGSSTHVCSTTDRIAG
jgi:hypothetical protein